MSANQENTESQKIPSIQITNVPEESSKNDEDHTFSSKPSFHRIQINEPKKLGIQPKNSLFSKIKMFENTQTNQTIKPRSSSRFATTIEKSPIKQNFIEDHETEDQIRARNSNSKVVKVRDKSATKKNNLDCLSDIEAKIEETPPVEVENEITKKIESENNQIQAEKEIIDEKKQENYEELKNNLDSKRSSEVFVQRSRQDSVNQPEGRIRMISEIFERKKTLEMVVPEKPIPKKLQIQFPIKKEPEPVDKPVPGKLKEINFERKVSNRIELNPGLLQLEFNDEDDIDDRIIPGRLRGQSMRMNIEKDRIIPGKLKELEFHKKLSKDGIIPGRLNINGNYEHDTGFDRRERRGKTIVQSNKDGVKGILKKLGSRVNANNENPDYLKSKSFHENDELENENEIEVNKFRSYNYEENNNLGSLSDSSEKSQNELNEDQNEDQNGNLKIPFNQDTKEIKKETGLLENEVVINKNNQEKTEIHEENENANEGDSVKIEFNILGDNKHTDEGKESNQITHLEKLQIENGPNEELINEMKNSSIKEDEKTNLGITDGPKIDISEQQSQFVNTNINLEIQGNDKVEILDDRVKGIGNNQNTQIGQGPNYEIANQNEVEFSKIHENPADSIEKNNFDKFGNSNVIKEKSDSNPNSFEISHGPCSEVVSEIKSKEKEIETLEPLKNSQKQAFQIQSSYTIEINQKSDENVNNNKNEIVPQKPNNFNNLEINTVFSNVFINEHMKIEEDKTQTNANKEIKSSNFEIQQANTNEIVSETKTGDIIKENSDDFALKSKNKNLFDIVKGPNTEIVESDITKDNSKIKDLLKVHEIDIFVDLVNDSEKKQNKEKIYSMMKAILEEIISNTIDKAANTPSQNKNKDCKVVYQIENNNFTIENPLESKENKNETLDNKEKQESSDSNEIQKFNYQTSPNKEVNINENNENSGVNLNINNSEFDTFNAKNSDFEIINKKYNEFETFNPKDSGFETFDSKNSELESSNQPSNGFETFNPKTMEIENVATLKVVPGNKSPSRKVMKSIKSALKINTDKSTTDLKKKEEKKKITLNEKPKTESEKNAKKPQIERSNVKHMTTKEKTLNLKELTLSPSKSKIENKINKTHVKSMNSSPNHLTKIKEKTRNGLIKNPVSSNFTLSPGHKTTRNFGLKISFNRELNETIVFDKKKPTIDNESSKVVMKSPREKTKIIQKKTNTPSNPSIPENELKNNTKSNGKKTETKENKEIKENKETKTEIIKEKLPAKTLNSSKSAAKFVLKKEGSKRLVKVNSTTDFTCEDKVLKKSYSKKNFSPKTKLNPSSSVGMLQMELNPQKNEMLNTLNRRKSSLFEFVLKEEDENVDSDDLGEKEKFKKSRFSKVVLGGKFETIQSNIEKPNFVKEEYDKIAPRYLDYLANRQEKYFGEKKVDDKRERPFLVLNVKTKNQKKIQK